MPLITHSKKQQTTASDGGSNPPTSTEGTEMRLEWVCKAFDGAECRLWTVPDGFNP